MLYQIHKNKFHDVENVVKEYCFILIFHLFLEAYISWTYLLFFPKLLNKIFRSYSLLQFLLCTTSCFYSKYDSYIHSCVTHNVLVFTKKQSPQPPIVFLSNDKEKMILQMFLSLAYKSE